ncbi:hypothetical protein MTO96_037428, partial [Rhipicephalus appendiculatus]
LGLQRLNVVDPGGLSWSLEGGCI